HLYSHIITISLRSYSFLFFLYCHRPPRDLHSFPTRRSSDLGSIPASSITNGSGIASATHTLGTTAGAQTATADVTGLAGTPVTLDRKSTRLNSSHVSISYAVFCLKKKKKNINTDDTIHIIKL